MGIHISDCGHVIQVQDLGNDSTPDTMDMCHQVLGLRECNMGEVTPGTEDM